MYFYFRNLHGLDFQFRLKCLPFCSSIYLKISQSISLLGRFYLWTLSIHLWPIRFLISCSDTPAWQLQNCSSPVLICLDGGQFCSYTRLGREQLHKRNNIIEAQLIFSRKVSVYIFHTGCVVFFLNQLSQQKTGWNKIIKGAFLNTLLPPSFPKNSDFKIKCR